MRQHRKEPEPPRCQLCGRLLVNDERHVKAPPNNRGIKCLVLLNLTGQA